MTHLLRGALGAALLLAASATLATPALAADPIRIGQTFITSGLDPTKGSNGWALDSHGVGENLFLVDKGGNIVPQLAASATRIDDLDWTIALAPGKKFSDGAAVTADLVAAALTHTMQTNPTAQATGGLVTFQAVDPMTLKVTTQKPVPLIQGLFAEWALIVYHLMPDGSATFTGPYAVASFTPDQEIDLKPNPYYPDADKRSDVVLRKFSDAQSLALAFEAGQLDLAFGLPSESVPRLKANPNLVVKSFPVAYEYMAFFNMRHPELADPAVRHAIDMAIDRNAVTVAINNGTPATGVFAPYFPFAEKAPRPFDAAAAQKLLDAAGWTRSGTNGMRAKNGMPLKVTIVAYPQRPDLVTMEPVIKSELASIGIDSETTVAQNINTVAANGDFDVMLYAQLTAPSGDPAFFFNSSLRSDAPNNYSGYASKDLDAILAGFGTEADLAKRNAIALKAQEQVFADAPISFLVTPDWYVGLSKRLSSYEPWGSDYHILRADVVATN